MTSALVVIDMQHDVMATCPAAEEVLGVVNDLIGEGRRRGVPIVFVRHHDSDLPAGSDSWQLDSRLDHRESDLVIEKTFRDGFADTDLNQVLRLAGIRRLVVTGAHSDYCVQTTAVSALAHGYDLTLVADGHAAEPSTVDGARLDAATVTAFVNDRMSTLRYPGRRIDVTPAARVAFE